MTQTTQLAEAFSKHLIATLGTDTITKVIRLNATPAYAGSCASHNFCDANMVMDTAFTEVAGRDYIFYNDELPETEAQNTADTELINAAWRLAKTNNFTYENL